MDQSQNISNQAGQAKGQAEEKASNLADKARNTAESAKESCQEAGQQVKAKVEGAADAVKNTIGANKFNVAQVLLALEYLHMLGVVYRDSKPQ